MKPLPLNPVRDCQVIPTNQVFHRCGWFSPLSFRQCRQQHSASSSLSEMRRDTTAPSWTVSSLLRAPTYYLTWVKTKNNNMIVAAAKSATRPVVSREKRLMFGMASPTPHPSIDLGQRFSSQKPRLSMLLFIRRGKASWQRSSLNVQLCSMGLRRVCPLKINSGMDYRRLHAAKIWRIRHW